MYHTIAMFKNDSLHIYCTKTVRQKLAELAEINHRSLSSEVQAMIEQAYAKYVSAANSSLTKITPKE